MDLSHLASLKWLRLQVGVRGPPDFQAICKPTRFISSWSETELMKTSLVFGHVLILLGTSLSVLTSYQSVLIMSIQYQMVSIFT